MPPPDLERDEFKYHTERALEVARATVSTLQAAEHHLQCLVREEELSILVFRDEIKDVRKMSQAAEHQAASLRAALQAAGITLKIPQSLAMSSILDRPSHSDPEFQPTPPAQLKRALDVVRATESSFRKEELQLEGLASGVELRIQALRLWL